MDNPEGPVYADDWEKLSRQKLAAAVHLKQIRSMTEAYEQAGYAVECALKARIMRFEGLNRWPDRATRRELYTHDPVLLLRAAGLAERVLAEMAANSDIGIAWSIVKEWSVDARYVRNVRPKLVRDMIWAIGPDGAGLLRWIAK